MKKKMVKSADPASSHPPSDAAAVFCFERRESGPQRPKDFDISGRHDWMTENVGQPNDLSSRTKL